jgi:hypothetical protein
MDPKSILEATMNELRERYENIRCEIYNDSASDIFFSHSINGIDAWRHALVITVTNEAIETSPGPLFRHKWVGGKRTFELCDPKTIHSLFEMIEKCSDGRAIVREIAKHAQ